MTTVRQRNWGARVREFEWLGMPAVTLENELLRVGVLAGRGSDVFELLYKPRDVDFVWLTAGGFRPADTFVDGYGGGWQEILPNGGAPSSYAGASFGQHDEVSMLPWDYAVVEDTEERVVVRLSVACAKTPLRLVKELRLEAGSARLDVDETLVNESPSSVRLMWGHHLAFGAPFLAPGARIRLPDGVDGIPHRTALNANGRRVAAERFRWPLASSPEGEQVDLSVLPPQGTASEIVYLSGFPPEAWYEVGGEDLGFRVTWDAAVMPYLWFWQEFGRTVGYPWYGRHWNVGLEPFSSYPTNGLAEAVANGTALELAPGERRAFSLSAEVVTDG
ncbi:MAG TPA: DUF4432 family protein [Gaiellaceae bacterium]